MQVDDNPVSNTVAVSSLKQGDTFKDSGGQHYELLSNQDSTITLNDTARIPAARLETGELVTFKGDDQVTLLTLKAVVATQGMQSEQNEDSGNTSQGPKTATTVVPESTPEGQHFHPTGEEPTESGKPVSHPNPRKPR